jgi:trk system potassium uptake protein TrkH
VTGLVTVDTGSAYSRFGHTVILLLIQFGGLGVMTFGAIAIEILGRRASFTSQAALQDVFFQAYSRGDLRSALRRIVGMTLALELIGAVPVFIGLSGIEGVEAGAFDALFHSVSAFCNAGFSTYDRNLEQAAASGLVVWTLAALIVLGGLGYTVLIEFGKRFRRLLGRLGITKWARAASPLPVHWSLNTRTVLVASGALIVGGAVALALGGTDSPGQNSPWWTRATNAVFHSLSARTAGFNLVPISALPLPALMVLIPLMFIGGSPGSCAGGIKTTSLAVWMARLASRLTGREQVNLGKRRIPHDVVRRAALVIAIAALWNGVGIMFLAVSEGTRKDVRFEHMIFEQVSAFGTVGLSAGVTAGLSAAGKLWIIASMFVGRLGPLTVALAVMHRPRSRYEYPSERVMIG